MRSLKIFAVGAVTPELFALCAHVLRGNSRELLSPASLPVLPSSEQQNWAQRGTPGWAETSSLRTAQHHLPGETPRGFRAVLLLFIDGAGMEQLPEGRGVLGSGCPFLNFSFPDE